MNPWHNLFAESMKSVQCLVSQKKPKAKFDEGGCPRLFDDKGRHVPGISDSGGSEHSSSPPRLFANCEL